jgi:hypothetical protein
MYYTFCFTLFLSFDIYIEVYEAEEEKIASEETFPSSLSP